MSAKGRGHDTEELEFYPTPTWVVEALLESDQLKIPGGTWIEPCAGAGNIIKAVNGYLERTGLGSSVRWLVNEINPAFKTHLNEILTEEDTLLPFGDFVHAPWPYDTKADVLIMNPPFSLTKQFIEAAFKRARTVLCVQRMNWFGSKGRAPWLRAHCPDVAALPDRASFRPDGQTDNCEYSWFIWPDSGKKRRRGSIFMLEPPKGGQQSLF